MQYPVHERFLTWQGEGVHAGRRAFFIRTIGCPVKCPWCDSAGTWHPKWKPKQKTLLSVDQLIDEALAADPEFIVVTGGEPTIYDLTLLCQAAQSAGLKIHLETSGTFLIRGHFDWVTLSPKRWMLPQAHSVVQADEFKIIVEKEEDIDFYLNVIGERIGSGPFGNKQVWLHPEWSKRKDKNVLRAISEAVTFGKHGYRWSIRAGYQLHKLYRVDALDPRTQELVPLGGNPKLGY